MRRWLAVLRYDLLLQARHGFYLATGVMVVIVSGLLVMLPAAARADPCGLGAALGRRQSADHDLVLMCGLILLERDEGTLLASRRGPGLRMRTSAFASSRWSRSPSSKP